MEAACLHGGDRFGILHEGIPDHRGAEIFCHQEADAEIDAEDVRIVPVEVGVEGVAETVAAPGILAEVFAKRAEDTDAIARDEGQRACGGAGND